MLQEREGERENAYKRERERETRSCQCVTCPLTCVSTGEVSYGGGHVSNLLH